MTMLHKILLGAGGALALAVAGVIVCLWVANARLEAALVQEKARALVLTQANGAFAAATRRQNAAVAQMKDETRKRLMKAKAAMEAAQKDAQAYRATAAKLRHVPFNDDACATARDLFAVYLEEGR